MSAYKHWRLERDADGLAWVTIDRAEASANLLTNQVMAELAALLDELEREPPRALVFRSGKAAGFIAGADIGEFASLATAEAATELVARGWRLFNRLAAVPYPTLALVRGHCLGGGLELALACRYRIAVDEPATRLGLPEVMLGIFPAWGGMLRLPRLIGPAAALDMMLAGKTVDAGKARRLGLADESVPARVMEAAARRLALSGIPARKPPLLLRLQNGPLKALVASQARKQLARRARPQHYPAPYAIIELWEHHQGNALAAPELLDRIIRSPTARNLVRVFFLQERLKGFGKAAAAAISQVHVIGAGVMGGDIAAWCALSGLRVTVQDQGLERIAPALARAATLFERRLRDPLQVRAALDRLIPDPEGHGARHADLVLEAVVEDLEVKRSLFRAIEAQAKPEALLATNTSSLRLEDIGTALQEPRRLVGIHFFNPVAKMPLVEVVTAAGGQPEADARACAFVRAIGKLPLPVQSAPGFLVNAVLVPYLLGAMRCVDAGLAPEAVDEALLAFGMPMGPIELADSVGLDIALAAGSRLAGTGEVPRCLAERVARRELGRKSGRGFYAWEGEHPRKGAAGPAPAGLAEELLAPLLAKARQLVAAGIVADADLADAGVIFGTGFAPFTGGPLHYAAARGADGLTSAGDREGRAG